MGSAMNINNITSQEVVENCMSMTAYGQDGYILPLSGVLNFLGFDVVVHQTAGFHRTIRDTYLDQPKFNFVDGDVAGDEKADYCYVIGANTCDLYFSIHGEEVGIGVYGCPLYSKFVEYYMGCESVISQPRLSRSVNDNRTDGAYSVDPNESSDGSS
jgi:hypothetical protein